MSDIFMMRAFRVCLFCFSTPRNKELLKMKPRVLLEKLIGEHGSSTVLKELLEILKDHISALEKENDALKAENALLKQKEWIIESELNEATEEIERLKPIIEERERNDTKTLLDPVSEKALKWFFDTGRGLSLEEVAVFLSTNVSAAQRHLDLLSEQDLIVQSRVGLESSRSRGSISPQYKLTPSGQKYVVKNLSK